MKKFLIVVAVLFGLMVGCGVLVASIGVDSGTPAGSDLSTNMDNPPIDDVEVLYCTTEFDIVTVGLQIVNNSSKTSDYIVTLTIVNDEGVKVGDALATTQNVEPGQVAEIEAFGTGAPGGTCKIAEVERFAS